MNVTLTLKYIIVFAFLWTSLSAVAQSGNYQISELGYGWSKTSVNATIFRKNSIASDSIFQFVAYYDSMANVVLARRKLNENEWTIKTTPYKGNVGDAHNVISIMLDGKGYVHMSWDHHNSKLNYCRSREPYSLEMGSTESMTGTNENAVTYPEFYRFSNGDLLFAYRDGGSGNGNLILNRYNAGNQQWARLQSNLIDGQGERNAYWQLHVGNNDEILLSWVWRESPDVASNHDICFARSNDGGITWENSKAEAYCLPIDIKQAEIVCPIAQNSNLINQTSMTSDKHGNVFICTYYKKDDGQCTNLHLIYSNQGKWETSTITQRNLDFDLSGTGSRNIPISRPQILTSDENGKTQITVVYRDEEHGDQLCLVRSFFPELNWQTEVFNTGTLGRWEPSFDTELWKRHNKLHLFYQRVGQGNNETGVNLSAQKVGVIMLK
ncbi:MAG: BNR repeat-containing protein [Prolixibacteraceae bacterium]|nr:BNR repeat-containing protein [Prolixibacteraceae bacterium]